MQTRIRTAIILSTITGLIGVWLVLAPFILGYQPSGDPWITATTNVPRQTDRTDHAHQ